MNNTSILVIEQNQHIEALLKNIFIRFQLPGVFINSPENGFSKLQRTPEIYDSVLVDFKYNEHWYTSLQDVRYRFPNLPVLGLCTYKEMRGEYTQLHNLLTEVFEKPFNLFNLVDSIEQARKQIILI